MVSQLQHACAHKIFDLFEIVSRSRNFVRRLELLSCSASHHSCRSSTTHTVAMANAMASTSNPFSIRAQTTRRTVTTRTTEHVTTISARSEPVEQQLFRKLKATVQQSMNQASRTNAELRRLVCVAIPYIPASNLTWPIVFCSIKRKRILWSKLPTATAKCWVLKPIKLACSTCRVVH